MSIIIELISYNQIIPHVFNNKTNFTTLQIP
jgi:hypothetical protein